MDLDKNVIKKIKGLILFTAAVCLVVMNFRAVLESGFFLLEILKPFAVGAAIAFVLNIPMTVIEKWLFTEKNQKIQKWKRPVSILLALITVILIIAIAVITVIPQITRTLVDLGNKIPRFLFNSQQYLETVFGAEPWLDSLWNDFDIQQVDWKSMLDKAIEFVRNGLGNVVTSTVSVASGIITGVVNLFVSLIFSLYILAQKEKLGDQTRRLLRAYLPEKLFHSILKIAALGSRNFTNFITGQCTEAVIIGVLFVVAMTLFGFPYAVLVGVLIAFMSLIPIVGAFIGCAIGFFLIMVDDPVKALWFLVLFLILQQLEGNLIYPHVVGSSVGLPSIWVLAAVTVGGSLMGVVGMLIFIPLISTFYSLIKEDVNKRNREKEVKTRQNKQK